MLTVTAIPAEDFPEYLEGMNKAMREWTLQSARGERAWLCSDCCCSDPNGMPHECFHGHQGCTAIIQRDKRLAMKEGNEPS